VIGDGGGRTVVEVTQGEGGELLAARMRVE
jgi:hypothetical protein